MPSNCHGRCVPVGQGGSLHKMMMDMPFCENLLAQAAESILTPGV